LGPKTSALLAGTALLVWLASDLAQQQLAPMSVGFAIVHEVGHVAAAAACAVWLVPAWGFRALLAAVLAGTLIDVDHAVAAGSIDPIRMMSLGARPATHSIAGVVLIGLVVAAMAGWRLGYAALVGAATHVVLDARFAPGVPLLAPLSADAHVLVAGWVLPALILGLGLVGVMAANWLPARPRPHSDVRRPRFS
jgi:membrane-bound metal-dependent hydrolase YbcI (DUF457 family)